MNTELEATNKMILVQFKDYRNHHPKTCKERLYLPRTQGGRGLLNKGITDSIPKYVILEKQATARKITAKTR